MNIIEIKIKNCKNCCFSSARFIEEKLENSFCFAPGVIHEGKYDINSYYKNYKKPKWCPLNNKELKITT